MKNKIQELLDLSLFIGEKEDYVQGGGGNISVKIDDELMLIKSSGYFLKDLNFEKGYSAVKFQKIREYLNNPKDNQLTSIVKGELKEIESGGNGRPSIETGFHALLGNYVIHSHSSYANILTCSKEGRELRNKIFNEETIWVGYFTPGEELTLEVKRARKNSTSKIIFLQNHGLIVFGDSKDEALNLHEKVNKKIKDHFNIANYQIKEEKSLDYIRDNILFPDQVVYTETDDTLSTTAAIETIKTYNYILEQIIIAGLTPNFISSKEANVVSNLESEKYRKGMVK